MTLENYNDDTRLTTKTKKNKNENSLIKVIVVVPQKNNQYKKFKYNAMK